MTRPTPYKPDLTPPPGIDRSVNQDDDSDHATDDRPAPHRRDVISGTDAFNKPGLVDTHKNPHA